MPSQPASPSLTCPRCASTNVVRIVYGFPGAALSERAEREEVVLGGCVVIADDPQFACKACRHRFTPRRGLLRRVGRWLRQLGR